MLETFLFSNLVSVVVFSAFPQMQPVKVLEGYRLSQLERAETHQKSHYNETSGECTISQSRAHRADDSSPRKRIKCGQGERVCGRGGNGVCCDSGERCCFSASTGHGACYPYGGKCPLTRN